MRPKNVRAHAVRIADDSSVAKFLGTQKNKNETILNALKVAAQGKVAAPQGDSELDTRLKELKIEYELAHIQKEKNIAALALEKGKTEQMRQFNQKLDAISTACYLKSQYHADVRVVKQIVIHAPPEPDKVEPDPDLKELDDDV